jgi:hypothetical protein
MTAIMPDPPPDTRLHSTPEARSTTGLVPRMDHVSLMGMKVGPKLGGRPFACGATAAVVQTFGILLGCTAACGVAIWLGILFEGDFSHASNRGHPMAIGFAMVAIAPLGWWLLLWAGAFHQKWWAMMLAWLLPFIFLPVVWILPAVASIPGILVYRYGRGLSR